MKKLALILAAVVLTACAKEPVSTAGTDNKDIQIEKLFTHDGVTVYRFNDYGRPVYFTSPSGNVKYSHSESCGKNCTTDIPHQTLAVNP